MKTTETKPFCDSPLAKRLTFKKPALLF